MANLKLTGNVETTTNSDGSVSSVNISSTVSSGDVHNGRLTETGANVVGSTSTGAIVRGEVVAGAPGRDGDGAGDMRKQTYDPESRESDVYNTDNHVDGTTNKVYTGAEKDKLSSIANGATANSSDSTLLSRSNHTGSQPASTISNFQTTVSANSNVSDNTSARHTHSNKAILDGITASYTTTEKTKLDGIQAEATANPNAVDGPVDSVDNFLAKFDGTTGKLIQEANVIVDDDGNLATGGISESPTLVGAPTGVFDVISEYFTDNGVGIEGIVVKDGLINGRNITADGSKLDGIEAGAKDDQAWGDIGGTLSNQTDLQTVLDGKSPSGHDHDADYASSAHNHTEGDITDLEHDAVKLQGVSIDPSVGSPSDGDIIVYRSAGSDFVLEAKPAGGSNPALDDVTDVTLTTVADNEVLAYDNGTNEWINQTAAEAGLATTDDISDFETTTQLDTRDTDNRDRANHTGTQTMSTISDAGDLATKDNVAPSDRVGGFHVGVISSGTLSTTGNKNITGVGFQPKMIMFYDAYSGGSAYGSMGAASSSSDQWAKAWGSRVAVNSDNSFFSDARCSISMTINAGGTASLQQEISLVSMNSDGFTINVVSSANRPVAYVAYG